MALKLVIENGYDGNYIAGLAVFLNGVSPILLTSDRWGFDILHNIFKIDASSAIFTPENFRAERRASIIQRANEILQGLRDPDEFIGNVGYDFSAVPEPYKTELKAFFAWRLGRPENRSHCWHARTVRLLEFIVELAQSRAADTNLPPYLIRFGHPVQDGKGNSSSALRDIMEKWLTGQGLSTRKQSQTFRSSDTAVTRKYAGNNSMPANDLVVTLIILREKMKSLLLRDIVLYEDVFPNEQARNGKRSEANINFFKFRLPWFREAARGFLLNKIELRELGVGSIPGFVGRLGYIEQCLLEQHVVPEIKHVSQKFIDETFLNWGNTRKIAGKNWYADSINLIKWACAYLPDWPQLKFDKRNLRKVKGEWPGGRGYLAKVVERTIPEEVMEQIFQKIDTLPIVCKRLIVIERYTGMRSIDLHMLTFDCLKPDPDDDRFMLLTFYQSKVKKWNTKPLHREDAAHAVVIKEIEDQRNDVLAVWSKKTEFLFPTKSGDAENFIGQGYTRSVLQRWCVDQGIRAPDGTIYEFGWHDFRHYYGTELALAGHDIVLIQMELGHSSADMTMVYVNQRLKLKKMALLDKGGGKFIDIKGQVDEKVGELAIRKEAALAVDVPGGLCSMPGQVGEWCEHNRACFDCHYFRADIEQLQFFEQERCNVSATIQRLKAEVAEYLQTGRKRMAEIGQKRTSQNEKIFVNLGLIIKAIKTEGSYSGKERKHKRANCVSGGSKCSSTAQG